MGVEKMKKVFKNLVEALVVIAIWDILDIITGESISVKANIIGFVVFFIIATIIDFIKEKKK